MNDTKLDPCPFCGDRTVAPIRHPMGGGFVVSCMTSDCIDGPIGRTPSEAIAAWNRRAAAPAVPGRLAEALALLGRARFFDGKTRVDPTWAADLVAAFPELAGGPAPQPEPSASPVSAATKPARAKARGLSCDRCASRCGPGCECDCHWEDTNLLAAPPTGRPRP